MSNPDIRLGVDIGGTFTDLALDVAGTLHTTKLLTTHAAPEQAILDGVAEVCAAAGITPGELGLVIHGTTLATNALIERKGAKTAFLTTAGFRDVIEIRTESRFDQYDLNIDLPPPLIPREDRHIVAGRIAASGRELQPLDEEAVGRFARDVRDAGFESVAVGLIHSYVNPSHETRAGEIIAAEAPGLSVSLSSQVSPQMREFERFNTVCANAFVKPLMASYLTRLVERLKEAGASCPVFLMHSGGGLISVEAAVAYPVRLLESGPAGGAIYAAHIAARHGLDRVLSFDMGGTTAKICLIENRTPRTARTFEVARTTRFAKGSGMPISIPVIEMVEIGAGGGSLARVDALRQVRVGPESAGSEPGPACYGLGGARPAVTDADLILGKLDAESFAGGDIPLFPANAIEALDDHIGKPLDLDATEAARAVAEIVDETMANAARAHAVESGKDLGSFTMIAFGGAAPLHAARLCDKLGIGACLVPPGAGVGSAIGFLRAPFGYETVRGAYAKLSTLTGVWLADILGALEAEARAVVAEGYRGEAEPVVERKAFMRYEGQGWEIPVALDDLALGHDAADALRAAFEAEYARLFGRPLDGLDIEVMNWSVRVASPPARIDPVGPVDRTDALAASGTRAVYDTGRQDWTRAGVVAREELAPGLSTQGPAVVQERETTTVLPTGRIVVALPDGTLRIERSAP